MSDDESAPAEPSSAELGAEESALLQRIYEVRRRKEEARQREAQVHMQNLADFTEALSEFVSTGRATQIHGLSDTAVMKDAQMYRPELEKFRQWLDAALAFISNALDGQPDPVSDSDTPPPPVATPPPPPAAEAASPPAPAAEPSTPPIPESARPAAPRPSPPPSAPAPSPESSGPVYVPTDDGVVDAELVDESPVPMQDVPGDPDPTSGRQGRAARIDREAQFREAKAAAIVMKDEGATPQEIEKMLEEKGYLEVTKARVRRDVIPKMGAKS